MTTHYGFQQVGDVDIFYREAGPSDALVILLLHGFPTASHMFRDLIPLLADRFRLIAPDLPGFGQTKAPPLISEISRMRRFICSTPDISCWRRMRRRWRL